MIDQLTFKSVVVSNVTRRFSSIGVNICFSRWLTLDEQADIMCGNKVLDAFLLKNTEAQRTEIRSNPKRKEHEKKEKERLERVSQKTCKREQSIRTT